MTKDSATSIKIGDDIVDRLVGEKEVCATLNISPRTLRRQVQAGKFPKPIQPSPGRRSWLVSWVNDFVRNLSTSKEAA